MPRYSLYIFDLDGTVYRGDEPIPFAAESICSLKEQDARISYLTNNSGHTREFFLNKLRRMGFPVELDEIYTSGVGCASYLQTSELRSVFVVGEPGLVATLRDEGFDVVNADENGSVGPDGGDSEAVVVGICRKFTYDLMNAAMQRLRTGEAFVATNPDTTYPMEQGRLVPGAGSVLAGIRACSESEPYIVGKPNPFLIDLILRDFECDPFEALVVGDRLDTDIESGRLAGCPTHLVLTGVTNVAPEGQTFSEDLRGLL